MSSSTIQLMLQCAGGGRLTVPGEWSASDTISAVMESVQSMLPPYERTASLRYLQTTIPQPQWQTTRLGDLGLTGGRALLTLEETTATSTAIHRTTTSTTTTKQQTPLESSLSFLLQHNFDAVTKPCVVTLIKILDNVLQKPEDPKVRCIRLSNPAFHTKVGQVQGGVQVLLACGFVQQTGPPPLLSNINATEPVLVLEAKNESTLKLLGARKTIARVAVEELKMDPNEDLPKLKPLPKLASASDHAVSANNTQNSFNPYRGQRFDGKSAATGINFGPDGTYVSPTETQLHKLQQQERKLEAKLQQPLTDRGWVAGMPNSTLNTTSPMATLQNDDSGTSDGSLLAMQFQKQHQERKQREEGGFTTKAMRNLQKIKDKKVYSHVSLRIQFPDGSFVQGKFLPKEFVGDVVRVMREDCFSVSKKLEFDLYISPPRRKLNLDKTLAQEELVPAAKVFCSWKGPCPQGGVGSFLKPNLFQQSNAEELYPTAKAIVDDAKKQNTEESSREEELMRRMMGGSKKNAKKSSSKSKTTSKPKWFKG